MRMRSVSVPQTMLGLMTSTAIAGFAAFSSTSAIAQAAPSCKDGFSVRGGLGSAECGAASRPPQMQMAQMNPAAGKADTPPNDRMSPMAQNRMFTVYSNFVTTNSVGNSAFKVTGFGGLPIIQSQNGTWTIETPVNIASLSKAITAVCVSKLVDVIGGPVQWNSPLSALIPNTINALQPQFRTAAGAITVEQLLRHMSGIDADPTQGTSFTTAPDSDAADDTFANLALNQALVSPGARFRYNNINYAILSIIIKTVSGESYESYCKRVTLTPQGASDARIGPGTRRMGAFGGWEMPTRQYSNWYARAFNPMAVVALSQDAQRFIDSGTFHVNTTPAPPTVTYGLGTFVRQIGTVAGQPGANRRIWHNGDWSSTLTTPNQFSGFAGMYENGLNIVVTFDRFFSGTDLVNLQENLANAALTADPSPPQPPTPPGPPAPPPPATLQDQFRDVLGIGGR